MKKKARDSRIDMSRHFDSSKHPRMLYIVEKHVNLYGDLGITFGSEFNLRSTALMKHV